MNDITLKLTSVSGEVYETKKCLSFRLEKEVYTPYSLFSGIFFVDTDVMNISDVEFFIGKNLVHKGFVDIIEETESSDGKMVSLSSRGYASLLLQGELPEGIISSPSLNSLFNRVNLPNVTHENSSDTVNYIYLNPHSSIWDACRMLCLKMHNSHPFISSPNKVSYTLSEKTLSFEPKNIISKGNLLNLKNVVSDIYMHSLEDESDTYSMHINDKEIRNLGIIREKYYAYDKMWAFDSYLGLYTKINLSLKGFRADFVKYEDYSGEDLNDTVIFDKKSGRINRILVNGSKSGIQTTLWRYYDRYNNRNN